MVMEHEKIPNLIYIMMLRLLRWFNVDDRCPRLGTREGRHLLLAEGHDAINGRMNRPILADVRVLAWAVPISLLTNEDFTRVHDLAAEALYATSLRSTISAVIGGATSFLVCHSGEILGIYEAFARRISPVLGIRIGCGGWI